MAGIFNTLGNIVSLPFNAIGSIFGGSVHGLAEHLHYANNQLGINHYMTDEEKEHYLNAAHADYHGVDEGGEYRIGGNVRGGEYRVGGSYEIGGNKKAGSYEIGGNKRGGSYEVGGSWLGDNNFMTISGGNAGKQKKATMMDLI